MRRRRFIQYAGFGGLGLALAPYNEFASAFSGTEAPSILELGTFDFNVSTLNRFGNVTRQATYQARFFPESLPGIKPVEMISIESGQFEMGASMNESQATRHEFPRHRVKLPSFFMSKTPITQSQWAVVAQLPQVKRELDPMPSHFQGRERPVESVSWIDAVEFCDRLTQHTGRQYRLPSESQWEYACRAGTHTAFNTGETITSDWADYVGTYTYQSESVGTHHQSTMPVGKFSANAYGLQDMHGNVWEWCADTWHRNYQGAPNNGKAWVTTQRTPRRTIRGGGWLDAPAKVRSASRSGYAETALNRTIGFRVVMA